MQRPLGISELFWWRLGRSSAANLTWTANIQGHISLTTFQQALSLAQRRHPILSVRVDASGDGIPKFVQDRPLKVPIRLIERTDPNRWVEETEFELNDAIPPEGGVLFRVVLLHGEESSDIVFNFHHCITDGPSAGCVVRDILSDYGRLTKGEPVEVLNCDLPPAFDTCIDDKFLRFFRTRSIWTFLRQRVQRMLARERQLPASELAAGDRIRLRLLLDSLTRDETQALIERCRAHSTTLFGAVGAAYLLEISRHLHLSDREHVSLQSSVGVRNYLKPPLDDEICCFAVSGVATLCNITDRTSFWDLASQVRSRTMAAISRGEMFYPGLFLRRAFFRLRKSQDAFSKAIKRGRVFHHITNDGVLKIPSDIGSLKVLDRTTAASVNAYQTDVITVAMATFDRRLGLSFFYVSPIVAQSLAEDIAKNTVETLKSQLA